jgi:hypothetical protein
MGKGYCGHAKRNGNGEANFFNDKFPFIHKEMAHKNIIIFTKNTEFKNLDKILCTLKCNLENRLRETVQVLEKLKRGGGGCCK